VVIICKELFKRLAPVGTIFTKNNGNNIKNEYIFSLIPLPIFVITGETLEQNTEATVVTKAEKINIVDKGISLFEIVLKIGIIRSTIPDNVPETRIILSRRLKLNFLTKINSFISRTPIILDFTAEIYGRSNKPALV
jgi:hypothetical protein